MSTYNRKLLQQRTIYYSSHALFDKLYWSPHTIGQIRCAIYAMLTIFDLSKSPNQNHRNHEIYVTQSRYVGISNRKKTYSRLNVVDSIEMIMFQLKL